jgi:hypothetical protein
MRCRKSGSPGSTQQPTSRLFSCAASVAKSECK